MVDVDRSRLRFELARFIGLVWHATWKFGIPFLFEQTMSHVDTFKSVAPMACVRASVRVKGMNGGDGAFRLVAVLWRFRPTTTDHRRPTSPPIADESLWREVLLRVTICQSLLATIAVHVVVVHGDIVRRAELWARDGDYTTCMFNQTR